MKLTKKEILKRYKKNHNIYKTKKEIKWINCETWIIWEKKNDIQDWYVHIFRPSNLRDAVWECLVEVSDWNHWDSKRHFYERLEKKVITADDYGPPDHKINEVVKYRYYESDRRLGKVIGIRWYWYEYEFLCSGSTYWYCPQELKKADQSLYLHSPWN